MTANRVQGFGQPGQRKPPGAGVVGLVREIQAQIVEAIDT